MQSIIAIARRAPIVCKPHLADQRRQSPGDRPALQFQVRPKILVRFGGVDAQTGTRVDSV